MQSVRFILNDMEQNEEHADPAGPLARVSAAELEFVEAVALNFEQQGLLRMAGRVLAWLLICDPPEQSFNQLAAALQASKGSISTALRVLVPSGLVDRVARPGERRDYYRIRPGAWVAVAANKTRQFGEFKELMERGLRLLEDEPPARRGRLQDAHALYDWLAREMPRLWARWEREQAGREEVP